jgi:hypothetical protein
LANPRKGTANYLVRLEAAQQALFAEMKPKAKALISLLDPDTAQGVSRSQSELRYTVDAKSILEGAPSLDTALHIKDVILPVGHRGGSEYHGGGCGCGGGQRKSTANPASARGSVRSSSSQRSDSLRQGSMRQSSFKEGVLMNQGGGEKSAVNPNAAAVVGLLQQVCSLLSQ